MSAQNLQTTNLMAAENGAYQLLSKPFDLTEVIAIVARALSESGRKAQRSLILPPVGRLVEDEIAIPPKAETDGGQLSNLSEIIEQHLANYFASFGNELPPEGLYDRVLRQVEQPLVALTLVATRGNQVRAAELLGLNRNTLRNRIKALDIRVCRTPSCPASVRRARNPNLGAPTGARVPDRQPLAIGENEKSKQQCTETRRRLRSTVFEQS
jgi:DNA-binding protein Fis